MIPKLKDVLDLLEEIAPTQFAEPWDNPGLQIGSYSQEIKKIFVALDPTVKALICASQHNAQLLLTHHPLLFNPLSCLNISVYPGTVIFEAIRSGISVVAAHTNLDVSPGGINDILTDLLDLENVEVLRAIPGKDGVGLGRIGELPTETHLSVFVKDVKATLGVEKLGVISQGDVRIRRLAVVGGSGGGLVSLASQKGADLLLTGDVGHHHALEAQSLGIALIDGGHFHIEKKAFSIFSERLSEALTAQGWDVGLELDEDETSPMRDG